MYFLFLIKDGIKAAMIEAMQAYRQYVERPKTGPLRCRFDFEFE